MKRVDRGGFARMLLVLALALPGCARTPPEQQLREDVHDLGSAIERHDAGAVEDALAADFIGPGGMDRKAARRLAQGMFLRYRDIGVTTGPLDIDLQADTATVRFSAAMTGGAGALPGSGQLYEVETAWRREDDEWLLVNAHWKPKL
ncbi:nuclear transport factor 2 family protein [Lysobacter yangpyeongensis]|uniref:Nuclear transport factor 2 family protein n=2 Tax=Lysobacter yangpyeongensis TaxID=346182 RepID=A0ABW0SK83_9GAMM